jgi:hypothetical protein
MLLSAVTLSFQLLCSKFVARTDSVSMKVGIYRFLHRRAWIAAVVVTGLLLYASPVISTYLNLPTRSYVDLLAAGVIFFIPLGVRRGFMQGMYDFPHLALNFVMEVVVKLVGAVLLINAGVGVLGIFDWGSRQSLTDPFQECCSRGVRRRRSDDSIFCWTGHHQ